jgi:hypothetical protein
MPLVANHDDFTDLIAHPGNFDAHFDQQQGSSIALN